uniref:HECT domain-containing protein n=1 Tax=Caenorhabditis tropicalis TaxID=1561998 RepID=A0A1I7T291_9PELO
MIRYVQIKSFIDPKLADPLVIMIRQTLFFLTQLILDLLSDESNLDTMQLENDDPQRAYQKPLEALNSLVHDSLCGMLLTIQNPSEVTEQLKFCLDSFKKLEIADKNATSLMELLVERHVENCKPQRFEYDPEVLTIFDLKNPSIRILIPIFACFKQHESCENIAATIQTFGQLMRVSGDDVIFDLLHASILLKCEESMDLLHLPKQHRVDFRWQSTTFFYKKLPEIIRNLIKGGEVSVEDVLKGLDRALDGLSMMFDAADASWQNASFLYLIKQLEPDLGIEAIEPLRQRRREHMKTTANLADLAETDDVLLKNSEIEKFLMANEETMNSDSNDFWTTFIGKINKGDCDDFDAITSILTAEGRITEAGKIYAERNKAAQQPSEVVSVEERIRIFDDTFLLLSRIIINNPSLSISLFVNGGPGKTEAERTIFYRWSMWFVRRVSRNNRPERQEDMDALRKEVEMLVRLANEEVGIEVEEEEEEKEEEKEKEEEVPVKEEEPEVPPVVEEEMKEPEVKDEEMPEEEEKKEEEVMDTSEEPVDPKPEEPEAPEAPEPAEEPEEPEVELPKEIRPVTWNEVHCPLPRIGKKTAKIYLSQMKETHQFWRKDDQNLNIGAIVAAIPRIGQLLVEEHEEKRHRIDRKAAEEHLTNILHAIDSMPSLFICLVQWLDCEPDSPARTSLAITMKSALEKRITSLATSLSGEHNKNSAKWRFVKNTVQQMIDEMIDKSPTFPEVTCTAFSRARRFCPYVARDEKPDHVKLKHAWYYMRQQAWASPHALRLLEHANIAGEYNVWSHIYINKTIKSGCGDIMKSSVDMIFSFLMMDDLNSIIRMHESLMDFWLSEDAGQCQVDGRFDPLALRAVIRLMAHVMLIAEWALDRLVNDGPPLQDPLPLEEPIGTPEPEDPLRREKWVFLLRAMLERTINRFSKILRKGVLSTVVNTIIQLVKSIAGAADCQAKRLLVRRIPPRLIFQLAYIEPSSVDYSLMNVFCDPNDEEHTRTKILFLCALRRPTVV